jgi:hypothetical protein
MGEAVGSPTNAASARTTGIRVFLSKTPTLALEVELSFIAPMSLIMIHWAAPLFVVGILLLRMSLEFLKALRTIEYVHTTPHGSAHLEIYSHHPGIRSLWKTTSVVPRLWGFSPEKSVTWLKKHRGIYLVYCVSRGRTLILIDLFILPRKFSSFTVGTLYQLYLHFLLLPSPSL